jgi:hypothetical protein
MTKLTDIQLYDSAGGYKGFGTLGLETGNSNDGSTIFGGFISSMIGVISVIAIIWFVFIVISSGISYMGAGADTKAAEAARKRISTGLVGLLITIFGIFIIRFAGQIFNIPDILNIPNLINQITIK